MRPNLASRHFGARESFIGVSLGFHWPFSSHDSQDRSKVPAKSRVTRFLRPFSQYQIIILCRLNNFLIISLEWNLPIGHQDSARSRNWNVNFRLDQAKLDHSTSSPVPIAIPNGGACATTRLWALREDLGPKRENRWRDFPLRRIAHSRIMRVERRRKLFPLQVIYGKLNEYSKQASERASKQANFPSVGDETGATRGENITFLSIYPSISLSPSLSILYDKSHDRNII